MRHTIIHFYLRLECSVGVGVRLRQLQRAATQRLPEGKTIPRDVVSLPHMLACYSPTNPGTIRALALG
jgi:hypothetical protein